MSLYEEYRLRMLEAGEARDRETMRGAYNEAIADYKCGRDIHEGEVDKLRDLYVDICYDNNWKL